MFLNCHTYYSLRYGTFSEDELLAFAQKNKVGQMVLTDINNTSACLNFIRKAPKYNIKPIVGIDFRNGNILKGFHFQRRSLLVFLVKTLTNSPFQR